MKRRIIALLLSGAMVAVTGCGANGGQGAGAANADNGVATQTTENVSAEAQTAENVSAEAQEEVKDDAVEQAAESAVAEESAAAEEGAAAEESAAAEEGAAAEKTGEIVMDLEGGVRFRLPEEFRDFKGVIVGNAREMGTNEGVYMTSLAYIGVTKEWLNELRSQEEPSEEDVKKYYSSTFNLAYIFGINGNRGVDEMVEFLNEGTAESEKNTADDFNEIGKAGNCTFFLINNLQNENANNLSGEFLDEYNKIKESMDDIIANAEYFEPVNPYEAMIGKKIEFTTTDIDGNPITSEEIFSKNDVTMVNVWATWCVWCIDELPELEKINGRLSEKNCAIVGLLGDGDDEEAKKEGKRLLQENGDTYLNILPWEGALSDDFPMDRGWPTSFFVDREGKIASVPVIGASVNEYEKVIDQILQRKDSDVKDEDGAAPTANGLKEYRVYVADDAGDPVEGAVIQFCDDSSCRIATTNAEGLAVLEEKEAEYTVHVLKVPSGYKKSATEYELLKTYSDLHIQLDKEG
ncbi:MAG: TlpA family protein disulfide reductase [Lachnospiraceae bacterium]|nr:TlpA family protein disulfide reductase [Lachnospiraceae bacterium]